MSPHARSLIDPRSSRAASLLAAVVLAAVLATGSALLLALQALVFALGFNGRSPYQALYRAAVQPLLGPPIRLEPAAPARFAQLLGLACATVGTLALLVGATTVATAAVTAVLAAALLNAAFGLCLGCEVHLLLAPSLSAAPAAPARPTNRKGVHA